MIYILIIFFNIVYCFLDLIKSKQEKNITTHCNCMKNLSQISITLTFYLGNIFAMAIHRYWNYFFFVIVIFGITYGVDRPNCNFSNNFIEPPGIANLPLTQEWFIWGQLFSYCLQVRRNWCMNEWWLNVSFSEFQNLEPFPKTIIF